MSVHNRTSEILQLHHVDGAFMFRKKSNIRREDTNVYLIDNVIF